MNWWGGNTTNFFLAHFSPWQPNERKILLAQMISTYLELLNTASKSQTTGHVKELLEALHNYKEKYSESLKKANDIIELSKLPVR